MTEGCTRGNRTRGRQRRRWREAISEWTGLHINVAVRSAEDRKTVEGRYACRPPFFNWRMALDDDVLF